MINATESNHARLTRISALAVERADSIAAEKAELVVALAESSEHNMAETARALMAAKAALAEAEEHAVACIAEMHRNSPPRRYKSPLPVHISRMPRRRVESPYHLSWSIFD